MNLLIVGGSSTVGRAVASRMAPRATIILADRDGDAVRAAAAELRRPGQMAHGYSVDISRSNSVTALFSDVDRDVGPIHSVFYEAYGYAATPIEDITEDDWDTMIATHVKGAYLCTKAVVPQMRERRAGTIVTVTSDYAVTGFADNAAYAAAKTALDSFTKSVAQAFAGDGIRVNAIALGAIESNFLRDGKLQREWELFKSKRTQEVPMRRLGQAEEVATVADFLLSERSSYLTGQIIHVNGGELMW